MSEAAPVLSIGAVLGDSDAENRAWKEAIASLSREVAAQRDGVVSALAVNVVFHVHGKLKPNTFGGVRTGRFDSTGSHLLVQAAVPKDFAGDRRDVLLWLLRDALSEAEGFAQRRGLADSLTELRTLIRAVGAG